MSDILIKKIDAVLPQTQCGQCGFAGCLPYASAIVAGQADINQCPPGDAQGIQKIAYILGIKPKPLNTQYGVPKPKAVALIDESVCIGCTFCFKACPVDAIVGAAKQMHTVISAECTGCELCLVPCPVDCISMIPLKAQSARTSNTKTEEIIKQASDLARSRHRLRTQRLERDKRLYLEKRARKVGVITTTHSAVISEERKKEIVRTAIKRAIEVRARTTNHNNESSYESS